MTNGHEAMASALLPAGADKTRANDAASTPSLLIAHPISAGCRGAGYVVRRTVSEERTVSQVWLSATSLAKTRKAL